MKLGIVGSGKVGSALGSWAAKSGYGVIFTARDESHAREAAKHAGHGAKELPLRDLVDEGELILLTLPYAEAKKPSRPFASTSRAKLSWMSPTPSLPITNPS
jgi:8-hydroxy-5-deazaflavin:NADPH oxidoreductase